MTADNLSKTVVSTRVRLARNLEGYPFPSHLKDEKQAKEIIRLVSSGLSRVDGFNSPDEFRLYYMDAVSEEEALSLKENHLISPKLIENRRYSAALINSDKSISIMLNEEDHLREQCIVKGLELRPAYEAMSQIDARISASMKFAFDEQLGYLTACPTTEASGRGVILSIMLQVKDTCPERMYAANPASALPCAASTARAARQRAICTKSATRSPSAFPRRKFSPPWRT